MSHRELKDDFWGIQPNKPQILKVLKPYHSHLYSEAVSLTSEWILQGSSVYMPQPAFAGFKLSSGLKFPFDFKKSGEWSTQFLPAKCILTYTKSIFCSSKPNISKLVVYLVAQVCSLIDYCHLESCMHIHADRKKILRSQLSWHHSCLKCCHGNPLFIAVWF